MTVEAAYRIRCSGPCARWFSEGGEPTASRLEAFEYPNHQAALRAAAEHGWEQECSWIDRDGRSWRGFSTVCPPCQAADSERPMPIGPRTTRA